MIKFYKTSIDFHNTVIKSNDSGRIKNRIMDYFFPINFLKQFLKCKVRKSKKKTIKL